MDKYDKLIDSVGRDKYDDLIDSVMETSAGPISETSHYDVERRSITTSIPVPPATASAYGPSEQILQGLFTNRPTSSLGSIGRSVPLTIGGAMAGPAGAAAGESLRQALVSGTQAARGETDYSTPLSVIGHVGLAAGAQKVGDLATPYILAGGRATGSGIQNALEYVGKNISGIKASAYDFAKANVQKVAKFIGANPETADALVDNLKSSISSLVEKGEAFYRDTINNVVKTNAKYGPGFRINIQNGIGRDIAEIQRDFGYGLPGRLAEESQGKVFLGFSRRANELSDAKLEEVYLFQKDLNHAIRNSRGTPLATALGKMKGKLNSYLEQRIPEIAEANAAYSGAKTLEEDTEKLTNANDIVSYVNRTFANKFETASKAALQGVAKAYPSVAEPLSDIQAYSAAQAFTPGLRGLPQTGFTTGLGLGAYGLGLGAYEAIKNREYLAQHPILAAGTAAAALALSPRAAFTALRLSQGAAGTASIANNYLSQTAGRLTPMAVYSLSEAYSRTR